MSEPKKDDYRLALRLAARYLSSSETSRGSALVAHLRRDEQPEHARFLADEIESVMREDAIDQERTHE